MSKFIIRLATDHQTFAITEMKLLLNSFTIINENFPFYIIQTTNENIKFYAERSIFCKNIDYFIKMERLSFALERIGDGRCIETDYVKKKGGTLIHVMSYGKKIGCLRDKLIIYTYPINENEHKKNNRDDDFNLNSRNGINNEKYKFMNAANKNDNIIEINNTHSVKSISPSFHINNNGANKSLDKSEIAVTVLPDQDLIYFGEQYCTTNRKKYLKWGIKNRKFIGHTSLDLELSIFMINACRLKRGSVIIDPCCGSCSILHAAAIFGIYGIGSEIQRSELIGRNDAKNRSRTLAKGYDVYSNFYQFGVMNYILGVCVADLFNLPIKCLKDRNSFASNERIVHQGNVKMPQKIAEDHSANFEYDYKKPQKNVNTFRIDAILTDPPYGIRASVKGNIIDYFKKLLEIGRNCEYVGFWAISNHKKAIFEIFKNFKLICAVDQRLANYERTVFIYRMKRD